MEELLIKDNENITLTQDCVLENAKNSIRTIADNYTRTKAYYNALGVNAVINYLKEKELLTDEIVNIHASSRMLADFEIADIQLPNLHIDVRVVFDEDEIFIPKKHFEHNFLPDIYLVFKFDEDLTNGTLLGFVEPEKINKQNQNEEYYFVNISLLTPVAQLEELIKSNPVKQQYKLTPDAEAAIEKFIMLYMDQDIDTIKLKKLLDNLKNNIIAREKLIEFENFERLSFMAIQEFKGLDIENNDFSRYIKQLVTIDEFAEFEQKEDALNDIFTENKNPVAGLFIDDEVGENLSIEHDAIGDLSAEENKNQSQELTEEDFEQTSQESEPKPIEEIVQEAGEINQEHIEGLNEIVVDEDSMTEVSEKTIPQAEIVIDEFEVFETKDEFEFSSNEDSNNPETSELIEGTDISQTDEISQEQQITEDVPLTEETFIINDTEESLELTDIPEEILLDTSKNLSEEIPEENLTAMLIEDEKKVEEFNITEALNVESLELDNETIIGLSEGVMEIDNPETILNDDNLSEEPLDLNSLSDESNLLFEEAPEIQFENSIQEDLQNDLSEMPIQNETENITDEQVDRTIEQVETQEDIVNNSQLNAVDLEFTNSDDKILEDQQVSIEELLSQSDDNLMFDDLSTEFLTEEISNENVQKNETEIPEEQPQIVSPKDDLDFDIDSENTHNSNDELVLNSDDIHDLDSENDPEYEFTHFQDDEIQNYTGSNFALAQEPKFQITDKKILIPVIALVAIIIFAGAGIWHFVSHKSDKTTINIDNNTINNSESELNIEDVAPSTTENSNVMDLQLDENINKNDTPPAQTPDMSSNTTSAKSISAAQAKPVTIQKIKKDFSQPNTYLAVSKIVWSVPEYLTYNDSFNSYLQTLGSTIKLNLAGDLLLINEDIILNKINIKVELKESGKKYAAIIEEGCGTKSVDELVLQSVKHSLNLLKPPVNSLDTADEDLYITIYL